MVPGYALTLHTLRNNPAYPAVAILVLALGVGLNAAVFSVVNTMLLRPLPFPKSQQLLWFTASKIFDAKVRAVGGLSAETSVTLTDVLGDTNSTDILIELNHRARNIEMAIQLFLWDPCGTKLAA